MILLAFGSGFIQSHIEGSGTFVQTARRIAASEHLYRAALSISVIASLGSALLAFALYATVKPVDNLLAQLAMIFNVGDSFLALVVRMCSFVRLHLFTSAQTAGAGTIATETLLDLIHNIADTMENIGGIAFGIGSLLFFYLFFKSRYIPRILSALGIFASVIWIALYLARLVFPEKRSVFQSICFPPMAVADVITGLYLMLFAVKTEGRGDQSVQRAAIREGLHDNSQ